MMWLDDHQIKARFILRDRDTKFSSAFDQLFKNAGIRRLRTPLLAPDANAFAEAWIGAIKRECLNHFLCFSLGHLDHINHHYARYYNVHRPHQGLGNLTVAQAATGPPGYEMAEADFHNFRLNPDLALSSVMSEA